MPAALRGAVRPVWSRRATILIDGPAGAGKSALAAALARLWPRLGPPPSQGCAQPPGIAQPPADRAAGVGRHRPQAGAADIAGYHPQAGAAGAAPTVLHMDDLYPGWDGLAAGSRHLLDAVLVPRSRGETGRWRSYDWERAAPGAWHPVPADVPLIAEGCGTLSRSAARLADLGVWVDADEAVRRRRFSQRDDGAFDHEWLRWQDQVFAFIEQEQPQRRADVLLWSGQAQPSRCRRSSSMP